MKSTFILQNILQYISKFDASIVEMGGDPEKDEAFLSIILKECIQKKVPPDAIAPTVQAAIEFSAKEGIPISEIPGQVKKREAELANLRTDIETAKLEKNKVLEDNNLTKEFVNEHIQFKERLKAAGLTINDVDAAINVLLNLKAQGYNGKKITARLSRIESLESEERRSQSRCEEWDERRKLYAQTYRLTEWFVYNGYTRLDLERLQSIITEIARREGITLAEAKGRLFYAFISYAALDGLIRQVNSINAGISILEEERKKLLNSLAIYGYFVEVIDALAREIGITAIKPAIDTMCEILASRYYRSNPHALKEDLKELRERRKKEQLQTQQQQQERDEVSKLKDGNDGRSSAAVPALPKRILKPAGDSSDQCKEEEKGGAVSGGERGGVGNNTHATIIRDASEQHDSNQQNGVTGQQT
jgi:hypothetical protein